jgi:hypothetical protein
MGAIFLGLAAHFSGTLSGILTNPAMDYIDDVLKITATWPDWLKRILVGAIGGILPVVITLVPGLHISANPADLVTKPEVQIILAFFVSLMLHTHNKAKAITSATGTAK